MSNETIPIKTILVTQGGTQVGKFIGIDFQGSGFELKDVGSQVQLTLSGGSSAGGSDTEFQWNNAGTLDGSSTFTWSAAKFRPYVSNGYGFGGTGAGDGVLSMVPTASRVLTLPDATDTLVGRATTDTLTNKTISGATYVSIGVAPSSTGLLRLSTSTASIVARNVGDTADLNVIATGSDDLSIWGTTAAFGDVYVNAPNAQKIAFQDAAVYRLILKNASINCSQKVGGDGSFGATPFRFMSAAITQNSTSDTTLTAAQYECVYIDISGSPGGDFNVIAPDAADSTYCVTNSTSYVCTFGKSSGTGTAIGAGQTTWLRHNGTNYVESASAVSTPAWQGVVAGAYASGDPGDLMARMQTVGANAPTRTNVSTTVARCSAFILPKSMTVNKIRYYSLGATGTWHVAIYRLSDLARLTSDLTFTSATGNSWGSVGSSLALNLSAGVPYFIAVGVDAVGADYGPAAFGPNLSPNSGQVQVAPASLPGSLALTSGYLNAYLFQFAVTAGAMPNPANTLTFAASWVGGMPAFWLDSDNS